MNYRKSLLGAAVSAAMMVASGAALAVDGIGNATVVISAPLSISEVTTMNFGQVLGSNTVATSVSLSTGGVLSTADATIVNAAAAAAGEFQVAGQNGATYSITLPASTTLTSGGNTMTVDTFNSFPDAASGGTLNLIDGTQALLIGATLHIGIAQPAGTYTGSYTVTVNYP